jgi:hypothetical protein
MILYFIYLLVKLKNILKRLFFRVLPYLIMLINIRKLMVLTVDSASFIFLFILMLFNKISFIGFLSPIAAIIFILFFITFIMYILEYVAIYEVKHLGLKILLSIFYLQLYLLLYAIIISIIKMSFPSINIPLLGLINYVP